MLPSTIIVATDGTPDGDAAVIFAAEMAKATHCSELRILTAAHRRRISGLSAYTGLFPTDIEPSSADLAVYEAFLEHAAKRARSILGDDAVRVETRLISAVSEADVILSDQCGGGERRHIVLGSRQHHRSDLGERLWGSVVQHVVTHAACPVTVVNPAAHTGELAKDEAAV